MRALIYNFYILPFNKNFTNFNIKFFDLNNFFFEQTANYSNRNFFTNFKLSSKLKHLGFFKKPKCFNLLDNLNILILYNYFLNKIYCKYNFLFYQIALIKNINFNNFYIKIIKILPIYNKIYLKFKKEYFFNSIPNLKLKSKNKSSYKRINYFVKNNLTEYSYFNFFYRNFNFFNLLYNGISYSELFTYINYYFVKTLFFSIKKIFFYRNFKFFNLLSTSTLLNLNYFKTLEYYINFDLPLLLKYTTLSSNSNFFNYLFFKTIYYKTSFNFFFFLHPILANYEVFLIKKNFLIFEPKRTFIVEILFFVNNFKFFLKSFNNNFLTNHFKNLNIDLYTNIKYTYHEYVTLLHDILLNDFDQNLERAGFWSVNQIWINELIKHILKLREENKPDDKAQYSPNFNHLHELCLSFLWGMEISFIERLTTLVDLRFFGSYDFPIQNNLFKFNKFNKLKSFKLIDSKEYITVTKTFWKLFYTKNNLKKNQASELFFIHFSTSLLSYWNYYKINNQQLLQYAPLCNINDNYWSVNLSIFIYSCLFWKIKYHYYWFYFGWSKVWTPNYFRNFFSKNYFIWNNLSNLVWRLFESKIKLSETKLFDLLSLNLFFYNFIFKCFFFSKRNLKRTTKSDFFYNQLWLNIFWSFKSFMLPTKNIYMDTEVFSSIEKFNYFYSKNLFFQNLTLNFENNFFLYSDIFFTDFFFDWKIFLENFNSDYFLENLAQPETLQINYFFKKKNLNLFSTKYFKVLNTIFRDIFSTYFSELVHDCYINFWENSIILNSKTNLILTLEKNDSLASIFSSCFNHWFFSSFNQSYLYNLKSYNKKIVFFLLKFFIFFELRLKEQLSYFKELFIEFFFIKLKAYKLNMDEDVLLVYFNFCLNTLINNLISDKFFLFDFIELTILYMFKWIFMHYNNNSWDTQLWKFLFSDFYLREFYPHIKLFFNKCIFSLIKELLEENNDDNEVEKKD